MRAVIKGAVAIALLAGSSLAMTAPAQARYHHGNNGGAAVAAGIIGLGIGAAIASDNRHYDSYGSYGSGYGYGYEPSYYAPPPAYYGGGYSYGYAQPYYSGYGYDRGYYRGGGRHWDRGHRDHDRHDRDHGHGWDRDGRR